MFLADGNTSVASRYPASRIAQRALIATLLVGSLSLLAAPAARADVMSELEAAPEHETGAQPDPAPDMVTELTVSPLEAFPGGTVHVTGTCTYRGYAATRVHAFFTSEDKWVVYDSVHVPIDPVTGHIDADIVVPRDARPGPHTFGWMCVEDDMVYGWGDDQPVFTILDPGPGAQPTPTPSVEPSAAPFASGPTAGSGNAARDGVDELAATGTRETLPALAALGALAAAGAAILALSRLTVRQRN